MIRHGFLALAVLVLAGCSSNAPAPGSRSGGPASITGTVTYRERVALPPDAEITVTLVDVSRADAAAIPLGATTFRSDGRQVPLAYAIPFDPSRVDTRLIYAVSARIHVGGKLAWVSDTHTPALTRGAAKDSIEVVVKPVAN